MGHKYQVDSGIEAASSFLSKCYSDDFDTAYPLRVAGYHNGAWEYFKLFDPTEANIGVVHLARLLDLPKVLPIAFMECCSLDPEALFAGYQRDDGTREHLSPEDIGRVLLARTQVVLFQSRVFLSVIAAGASKECVGEGKCETAFEAAVRRMGAMDCEAEFSTGWHYSWMDYSEPSPVEHPCEPCMWKLHADQRAMWRVFWDTRWKPILGI